MSGFLAAVRQLFGQVVFWFVVQPWEQALRVRAGKHLRRMAPGFYLKIPVIDTIHKQTVRRRNALIATQTLSTADGATLVIGASLGYAIADIERLYQTLHDAEDTLRQMTAAALAAAVMRRRRDELEPAALSAAVTRELARAFDAYGLSGIDLRVTDFAFLRAIRLIQDHRWGADAGLSVEKAS